MDEYISKQSVLDYLNGYLHSLGEGGADDLLFDRGQRRALTNAIQDILAVEAADVQPVIRAHWRCGEEKGVRTYNPLWYCSNCGGQIRYDTRMRQYQKAKRPVWEVNAFCRKCGARMDGDTE